MATRSAPIQLKLVRPRSPERIIVFGLPFTPVTPDEAMAVLLGRDEDEPFTYVVTPNAQHVVLAQEDLPRYRTLFGNALLSLCDSRVVRRLAKLAGYELPLTTGSDLTMRLFERHLRPHDRITVIGSSTETIARLRTRYDLRYLHHYDPPMNFINSDQEVQTCVDFVREHPARFVLLTVGAPQQEILAERIAKAGGATGIGLCVGGSLNFIVGTKARAPLWLQKAGLEWFYRMLQEPLRLGPRYIRTLPILGIAAKAIFQRQH